MSEIEIIANKIKDAGGRLYLVGGAVRDELLGKEIHDEDYCVTGIKDFQKLFPEAYVRGKDFAVFDINGKEFAMARTETFGKGVTPKEQYPHHYGHENSGPVLVENFGRNLKIPNNWLKCGKTACREHMRGGIFYKMKPSKKVEFIERVDKSLLGLEGLQIVVISDKTSGGRENNIEDINFEEIGKQCINEINGEYIQNKYNIKPGIELGKKLHEERIKWLKEKLK